MGKPVSAALDHPPPTLRRVPWASLTIFLPTLLQSADLSFRLPKVFPTAVSLASRFREASIIYCTSSNTKPVRGL